MGYSFDGASFVMAERRGAKIGFCPHYRGVCLDRGELDKFVERSSVPARAAPGHDHGGVSDSECKQQFANCAGKSD